MDMVIIFILLVSNVEQKTKVAVFQNSNQKAVIKKRFRYTQNVGYKNAVSRLIKQVPKSIYETL